MSTSSIDEKVDIVKDVFKCTSNQDYIKRLQSWGSKPNFRYKDACLSLPEGSCFMPEVGKECVKGERHKLQSYEIISFFSKVDF